MLSKRLQQIADMVTPGRIPADIGTDHAYVPIRLILDQKAGKAFAMDIGAGPLERAREHIRAEGLEEKIEVRQSDGLKKLAPGEADAVIIAGMGGALTVRILTEGMHVLEQVEELVLSPHSEIEKVREWVLTHGYEIADEEMLIDEGKFYTVLRAERSGCTQKEDADLKNEVFLRYGKILIKKKHPVLRQALEREEQVCRKILSQCPTGNTVRIKELQHRLRMIDAARKFMTDEMERGE